MTPQRNSTAQKLHRLQALLEKSNTPAPCTPSTSPLRRQPIHSLIPVLCNAPSRLNQPNNIHSLQPPWVLFISPREFSLVSNLEKPASGQAIVADIPVNRSNRSLVGNARFKFSTSFAALASRPSCPDASSSSTNDGDDSFKCFAHAQLVGEPEYSALKPAGCQSTASQRNCRFIVGAVTTAHDCTTCSTTRWRCWSWARTSAAPETTDCC